MSELKELRALARTVWSLATNRWNTHQSAGDFSIYFSAMSPLMQELDAYFEAHPWTEDDNTVRSEKHPLAPTPPQALMPEPELNERQIKRLMPEDGEPDGGWAQIDNHHLRKLCRMALRSYILGATPGTVEVVLAELERATKKFPTWPTDPLHALAVLGEEFGELTKAMLQLTYEPHKTSPEEVRMEAIQTAAMALRLLNSLDKYEYKRGEQHAQAGQKRKTEREQHG